MSSKFTATPTKIDSQRAQVKQIAICLSIIAMIALADKSPAVCRDFSAEAKANRLELFKLRTYNPEITLGKLNSVENESVLKHVPRGAMVAIPKVAIKKSSADRETLRDYSITLQSGEEKVNYCDLRGEAATIVIDGAKNISTEYYPVTRPQEKNIIAVIAVIEGQRFELNPQRGFAYGPIPDNRTITLKNAEEMWRASNESSVNDSLSTRSYKLISTNSNLKKVEFDLKCAFSNDFLTGVCITSSAFQAEDWNPKFDAQRFHTQAPK